MADNDNETDNENDIDNDTDTDIFHNNDEEGGRRKEGGPHITVVQLSNLVCNGIQSLVTIEINLGPGTFHIDSKKMKGRNATYA